MEVIRIGCVGSDRVIDLGAGPLAGTRFTAHDFHAADLRNLDLSGVVFRDCELRGAYLDWANLEGADFAHERLLSASMRQAHLRGARMRNASMRGANLSGACLIEADMTGANLDAADLSGANLCGAICLWNGTERAKFKGAVYDARTLLPPGFRPEAMGMIACKLAA